MSQYQILDWLNENANRAYPLKQGEARTLGGTDISFDKILLDANIVYTSGSLDLPNEATLDNFTVSGNTVTVTINGQTAFTFNKSTVTYPAYIYNNISLLVIGEEVLNVVNGSYAFDAKFEPSVVSDFRGAWKGVESITVEDRETELDEELTGEIIWEEGYQIGIAVPSNNQISIVANFVNGDIAPCGLNLFDYPEDCDEIIAFINGVTVQSNPGKFEFVPSGNVVIYEDSENHRIYIGLNFDPNDLCEHLLTNPSEPNVL